MLRNLDLEVWSAPWLRKKHSKFEKSLFFAKISSPPAPRSSDQARDGIRWCGMVWHAMVWRGVRWYGVRWHGIRLLDAPWLLLAVLKRPREKSARVQSARATGRRAFDLELSAHAPWLLLDAPWLLLAVLKRPREKSARVQSARATGRRGF